MLLDGKEMLLSSLARLFIFLFMANREYLRSIDLG